MAEERLRRILFHVGMVGAAPATAGGCSLEPCGTHSKTRGGHNEVGIDCGSSQGLVRGGGVGDDDDHKRAALAGGELGVDMREGIQQGIGEDMNLQVELETNVMDSKQNTSSSSSTASRTWRDVSEHGIAGEGRKQEAGAVSSSLSYRGWGSGPRPADSWPIDWPVADDCIFCKIVHGYAPAFKLYEDEFCICILDINPLCYGHSLLVPKGHFSSLDVTPPPIAAAMCSVVPLISNALMEATSCDAFNMVVNNGEAAGQVVFHTHFHIVPRFSGDGLWTSESVDRKTLSTFKDPTQLTHVGCKLTVRTHHEILLMLSSATRYILPDKLYKKFIASWLM